MKGMTPKHRAQLVAMFAAAVAADDAARGFWARDDEAPPCETYADRLAYLRQEGAEPWEGDLSRFLSGFGDDPRDYDALVRSWRHYLAQYGPARQGCPS